MLTNETIFYWISDKVYFCTDVPYSNLAGLGLVLPLVVWALFYLLIYNLPAAPFKRKVRTVFWVVFLLLHIGVFAGSYATAWNYTYPENLLCQDGASSEEVIKGYQESYSKGRDQAIIDLLQQQGINTDEICQQLTWNNLAYCVLVSLACAFAMRFGSKHARYAPY